MTDASSVEGHHVAATLVAKSSVDPITAGVSNIVAPTASSVLVEPASLGGVSRLKTPPPASVHRGSSEEVEDNLQQLVMPVGLGGISPAGPDSSRTHAPPKRPSIRPVSHASRSPPVDNATSTAPRRRSPSSPTYVLLLDSIAYCAISPFLS